MKIEYVGFELNTPTSSDVNRLALAEGVTGVKVLYAGPLSDEAKSVWGKDWPWQEINDKIALNEYFGTVEVYKNGAVNLYVRKEGKPIAVGFLRMRLERWEELKPIVDDVVRANPDVDLGGLLLDLTVAIMETYYERMEPTITQYQDEIKAVAKEHNHLVCEVVDSALEHMTFVMPRSELDQLKAAALDHIRQVK